MSLATTQIVPPLKTPRETLGMVLGGRRDLADKLSGAFKREKWHHMMTIGGSPLMASYTMDSKSAIGGLEQAK